MYTKLAEAGAGKEDSLTPKHESLQGLVVHRGLGDGK